MSNDIIFKTFRTYRHPYVYDRHTNAIVMLTEDEFQELSRVECGELPANQSIVIANHQEQGLFAPNVVESIDHYGAVLVKQHMNTRLKQLILQVTQQCNLRCSYCAYSGSYDSQRTHSNQRMQLETAKKAIDFFLGRNNELADVIIGFYGGEPLLEFDLIRHCVEYAKGQVEGKRLRFNMTTNGTLLSGDIAEYLVKNGFGLSISLDGSKDEHDANRKFANGEGSFDTIMKNVRELRDRYPKYDGHISFMATINPHIDLECVMEYFSAEEVFSDTSIVFNNVNEAHLKGDLVYGQNYYGVRNYEYMKMLFAMVGKLDDKYVSPLVGRAKSAIEQKQRAVTSRMVLPSATHHGGPCLPGVQRLFVRTDGALFPCERVGEMLDFFVIGNLEDGFDIEKMKRVLNIGKLTEDECKRCWGLRNCTICASQVEFTGDMSKDEKIKECPTSLNRAISELRELCVLNEFGLDVEGLMVQ